MIGRCVYCGAPWTEAADCCDDRRDTAALMLGTGTTHGDADASLEARRIVGHWYDEMREAQVKGFRHGRFWPS